MSIDEKKYSIRDIAERLFNGMVNGENGYDPKVALEDVERFLRDGFNVEPKEIQLSLETRLVVEGD